MVTTGQTAGVATRAEGERWAWLGTSAWLAILGASVALVVLGLEGRPTGGKGAEQDMGIGAAWLGRTAQTIADLFWFEWELDRPASAWVVGACIGLGTLGALVATTRFAARPSPALRFVAMATTLVGVWSIAALLPSLLVDEVASRAVGRWIFVPSIAVALYLSAKLMFLYRASAHFVFEPGHDPTLLSHQQAVFDGLDIRPFAEDPSARTAFRLHQVTGDWGAGKTEVLHKIRAACHEPPVRWLDRRRLDQRVACVCVDIWQHDTERDLHRAIVGAVLDHPGALLPWGWLRYPVFGSVASYLRSSNVKIPVFGAELDVSLPRLTWQRPFERAALRFSERHVRLVIILDEIDRAQNLVAQAALGMVHRSLDRPGVTVVLVHVPEVLDHKAFNPLAGNLDDLRSTATASIQREAQRLGLWPDLVGSLTAHAAQPRSGPPADADEGGDEEPTGGSSGDGASPAAMVPWDLDLAAQEAYARFDDRSRARVVRNLREKFLSNNEHLLGSPTAADVRAMLSWPEVAAFFARATDVEVTDLAADLETEIQRWRDRPLSVAARSETLVQGVAIPPIRPLKNALVRVFSDVAGDADLRPLAPGEVVMSVLVALETCHVDAPTSDAP